MEKIMAVRGIRGATTAPGNNPSDIYQATSELLTEMIDANSVVTGDIASVLFSATADLNSAFPARAARDMGWSKVPLFCHAEIDVPDALPQCIRILMLINTNLDQDQIRHIYLKETVKLREL